jgi:hypothetical protein
MPLFDNYPKGPTKAQMVARLPKIGDVRWERPTIDSDGSYNDAQHKTQKCVVVEVHPEHLWYTVQFENGIRESYKVPKYISSWEARKK